ncbi:putative polyketide synthase [Pseudomonas entomophila L48]|nr:putative polyketide synthase [Pseudomonas entomophila L48]
MLSDGASNSAVSGAPTDVIKQSLLRINALKVEVEKLRAQQHEPIAIVGMSCRFPGKADSPAAFWENLAKGHCSIEPFLNKRWGGDSYSSSAGEPGTTYQSTAALIDNPYGFDASFFSMSEQEARRTDPQHRLLLELSWQALEHSGIDRHSLSGSATGVYIGLSSDDYADFYTRSADRQRISPLSALGCGKSIAPGRISYFYNLRGPALQVDTSCSSALVAADLACKALRSREIDAAFVGGVNLMLTPGASVAFSAMQALSRSGSSRPFDSNADGYVRGEGGAVLVLKRLSDAQKEKLPIWGLIRGSAVNHDGKSNGMTAPSGIAQQEVISKALENACMDAADVGYVECHGTATPLGDPIELGALARHYGKTEQTWIGSVKSNIGHLEAAAGLAGLIKAVLSARHGRIVPSLHCSSPTPHFDWSRSQLCVATSSHPWPRGGASRVAAVSSFGMSGTNAHVIVSSADDPDEVEMDGAGCLTLSAPDHDALRLQLQQLRAHVTALEAAELMPFCRASNRYKSQMPARFAYPVADRQGLLEHLDRTLAGKEGGYRERLPVCLVFAGQGGHYPGMSQSLYRTNVLYRQALDEVASFYQEHFEFDLLACLFEAKKSLSVSQVQVTTFALQYALARCWAGVGVVADAVIGHSLGEYAAACCAGVLTLEQAARMVWHRGRLIEGNVTEGCMYAVHASAEQANGALGNIPFSVAAINTPQSCVLALSCEDELACREALKAADIAHKRLDVERAYHSQQMDIVLPAYATAIEGITPQVPSLPFYSTLTGKLEITRLAQPDYWVRHIRDTVRFADAVRALMSTRRFLFLEIGPGRQMATLINELDNGGEHQTLSSLDKNQDDSFKWMSTLSALFESGQGISWGKLHDSAQRADLLPPYRFNQNCYSAEQRLASYFSEKDLADIVEAIAHSS